MLFNSLSFMVFLVIVVAIYYSNLLNWSNRKRMLLFTSYVFYGLWNPPLIIILWLSTLVDWVAANKLYVEENQRKRNGWLFLSMFVNLGFLGFFKYGNFLLENFTLLMNSVGIEYQAQPMDIILPMGISFYTFQTMSYTLDMYNRKTKPAKTFLDFALYVTFFPQLVAGPIVRAGELIEQFYEEKKATVNQFIWGLFLLTLGLFQKVVLADTLLSDAADTVFGSKEATNFWDSWAGTLAFSGQIFFDFAGYSTCAIGIAMMLGFVLPVWILLALIVDIDSSINWARSLQWAYHSALLGAMAATVAVLTFLYGLVAVLLTHFLAARMRANPTIGRALEKLAGVFLIGFGVKLALSK